MKKIISLIVILSVILISGCIEQPTPNQIPTQTIIRPDIEKAGFGVGGGSGTDSPQLMAITGTSADIKIGAYHNAIWTGSSPASVSSQTTFDLANYPKGDRTNSNDYATVIGESVSQSKSEIPITIVNLGKTTSGGSITISYYHPDGRRLYSYTHNVPDPYSQSWCVWSTCWWNWYTVFAWIGYFDHEINEAGTYRVDIETSWGSDTRTFNIIDSTPIECSETDSGIDKFKFGITTLQESKEDICIDSNTLKEYYCNDITEQIDSTNLNCEYGCEDGVCRIDKPYRIRIGKYHSLHSDGIIIGDFPSSTFDLANYPKGDHNNRDDYAVELGELAPSEIVVTELYAPTTSSVRITYYYPDGTQLFSITGTPDEDGWFYAWIGNFPREINKIGTYRVDIETPWAGETRYFEIIDTSTSVSVSSACVCENYQCKQLSAGLEVSIN